MQLVNKILCVTCFLRIVKKNSTVAETNNERLQTTLCLI